MGQFAIEVCCVTPGHVFTLNILKSPKHLYCECLELYGFVS